jgi:hypothetical protein
VSHRLRSGLGLECAMGAQQLTIFVRR